MGGIFGGPAKSKSSNQAYGTLKDAFSGALPFTQQGGNAMMALLGGDSSGFDKFKQATGFDFLSKQGSQGITGNAAAKGLLRSGGTGKALMDYGAGMQNKYANDYLSQLLGVGNLGLGAGGLSYFRPDPGSRGCSPLRHPRSPDDLAALAVTVP